MSKFLTVALGLVGLSGLFLYQNCGPSMSASSTSKSGVQKIENVQTFVVKPQDTAGCKILLCSFDDSGEKRCFVPIKLDPKYAVEGNVLEVNGEINGEMVTTCNAGSVLQVNSVKLISGNLL